MELNKELKSIFSEYKIESDKAYNVLLAIYFDLDLSVFDGDLVQSVNIMKIVEKNFDTGKVEWNLPLFEGEETRFGWVRNWMEPFGRLNPERRGSSRNVEKRMKDFFRKYPEYRKTDIFDARDRYLATITNPRYLMKPEKFVFDGMGAMKKSTLLEYCEQVTETMDPYLKGKMYE